MIPNLTYIVQKARDENPQAWRDAHTGNEHTEDFIRIVAPMMYAVNKGFGLNGKRGNPRDISDDAINFIGEGPGTTPGGQPCTVIDIIGGAGGPNPQPQWGVMTDPVAASGAWVNPNSAPGFPHQPPSPPKPVLPSRQELMDEMAYLHEVYKTELLRKDGLWISGHPDFEGIAAWVLDVYLASRIAGRTQEEARQAYINAIRNSQEWKEKHPGERP